MIHLQHSILLLWLVCGSVCVSHTRIVPISDLDGQIWTLKSDVISNGKGLRSYFLRDGEQVTSIEFRQTPSRWPDLEVVEGGTRFAVVKADRVHSMNSVYYTAQLKYLTSSNKGKLVQTSEFVRGIPLRDEGPKPDETYFIVKRAP